MLTWIPLNSLTTLGNPSISELGRGAITATSIYDCSCKVRVIVGPYERKEFESFLEHGANHALSKQLIETYITEPLDYNFEILLQVQALIPVETWQLISASW
jgi:predicted component of type VI protein secretion system